MDKIVERYPRDPPPDDVTMDGFLNLFCVFSYFQDFKNIYYYIYNRSTHCTNFY